MARRANGRSSSRGTIERRGNSLRVKVYAGVDPLTGRRLYLSEPTTDEKEAERILNRFRAQVDEQCSAQTRADVRVAIGEWLKVHELDDSTREAYRIYARKYIYPALGRTGQHGLGARPRAVLLRASPLPRSL
ncbi:hypothetical protein [Haloechinothrix aidingensis]|uniref:hypothetical protein n=1 Tax=Haloechinothrix aidingensis TaxID=2752311 RepID=UPI0015DFB7AC|nr:hypothetical protein [Haloechinothrix aidingensis]